jgi:hypothetical protein
MEIGNIIIIGILGNTACSRYIYSKIGAKSSSLSKEDDAFVGNVIVIGILGTESATKKSDVQIRK